MRILIICSAGMSSSSLVLKMREYVKTLGAGDLVGSCASNQIEQVVPQADLVFLAPQLIYMRDDLEKRFPDKKIIMISAEDYGNQNAEHIYMSINEGGSEETEINPLMEKLLPLARLLGTNRVIAAISNGLMRTLPITFCGSILVLLNNFVQHEGLNELFGMGVDMTINCLSIYACVFISLNYARSLKVPSHQAAINALICFLMIIGATDGMISLQYLGASGLFCAIFVAIFFTWIYSRAFHTDSGLSKRLSQVPKKVFDALTSLGPTMVSVVACLVIVAVFRMTPYGTLPNFVLLKIQNGLSGIFGSNILAMATMTTITNVLWMFGMHGGSLVGSITTPLLAPLTLENLEAVRLGLEPVNIISAQFRHAYTFGGAGSTLMACVVMAFFCRSDQLKNLGRLALPMGIFFINEPIIFGLPIVFNPLMAIPFIGVPLVSQLLTYFVMRIGLVPLVAGYELPWVTPPIITGFIQGGWKLALWQVVMLGVQFVLWYPFIKVYDRTLCQKEGK